MCRSYISSPSWGLHDGSGTALFYGINSRVLLDVGVNSVWAHSPTTLLYTQLKSNFIGFTNTTRLETCHKLNTGLITADYIGKSLKLFLCPRTTSRRRMGGVEAQTHEFLTSLLCAGSGRFVPVKRASGLH
jgi:hypothetical protein